MQEKHVLDLHSPDGPVRLVLARQGRLFTVKEFEVVGHPELCAAFAAEQSGFENLDEDSDIAQCFNLSTRVRYDNVTLDTLEMKANSIEELAFVIKKVKLRAYNPEAV